MLTIFQAVADHPFALVIAAAFGAFQVRTCYRLCKWLNRQSTFAASARVFEKAPDECGWFEWVARHFRPDRASVLSRGDALKELDHRMADEPPYALLQRLSVGAPLIGVLITAFGFLNPPAISQTESLGEIFAAVTPLILGVAYGAMLALFNQALLYHSERRMDEVRSQARDWFDENVWLDRAGSGNKDQLADSMRDLASELGHQFRAIDTVTNVLAQCAGALQQSLLAFSSQIDPLPSSLALFKSASDVAAAAVERLASLGLQVGEQFTGAVSTFQATVDGAFSTIAKQQDDASGRLVQTAARAHDIVLKMEQAAEAIEANSRSQQETADRFHRSVIDTIVPHNELALEELQRLHSLASGLSTTMAAFDQSFSAFASQSEGLFAAADSGVRQFATAATTLQGAIEKQFEPAARLHQAVLTSITATTDRTQTATQLLQEACGFLQSAASDHATAARELAKSVDTQLTPAHSLLDGAAKNFDRTAEELAEHADRMRSSLNDAATSLNALLPLARQAFHEMPNAVNEFRVIVNKQFEPAAQLHADAVERIGGGVNALNGAVAELQRASAELSHVLVAQRDAGNGFAPACDAVQAAAGELKQVAHSLHGAVASDMLPAQQELHVTTNSLRSSAEMLAAFIKSGVAPATQRLRELDATIATLHELVQKAQPLSVLANDVTGLSDAILQASHIRVVLADLPHAVSAALAPSLSELASAVSALESALQSASSPAENGKATRKSIFRRLLANKR